MGGALMLMFFVVIGAAAGSLSALATTGWLAAFILLQLAVHVLVVLGAGTALRLPMQVCCNIIVLHTAVGGIGPGIGVVAVVSIRDIHLGSVKECVDGCVKSMQVASSQKRKEVHHSQVV